MSKQMTLKMIAATALNGTIGYQNKLPWYLKADMKRFHRQTVGSGNNAVIMGMNTWQSLPMYHLPKRDNYVLTRNNVGRDLEHMRRPESLINNPYDHIESFSDIEKLLQTLKSHKYDDVWVIGGTQIYQSFIGLNQLKEIHLTRIFDNVKGDTFFPKIPAYFNRTYITDVYNENSTLFAYETLLNTKDF